MKLARLADKLAFSNVVACLALFIALGGAAVAASTVAKNSVGTKQLKANAVTAAKIKNGAVNSHKLAHGAVVAGKIGANSISSGNLQNGSVIASKLGKGSVTNPAIANGVVGTNKLGSKAVTSVKLADNSVGTTAIANDSITPAKLAPEFGPILGTLKSGQTLRGVFDVGASTEGGGGDIAREGVSYQFPLSGNPPTVTVLKKGQTTANCPGIGSGSAPTATGGNLCVYLTEEINLDESTGLVAENNTRLGFGLKATAKAVGEFAAMGQWAVTAP
jgi:hypothetical protein